MMICRKQLSSKWLLALVMLLLSLTIEYVSAGASDTVKNEEVLSEIYAGAAQDIEVDLIPSQEEVEQIIADNAWKAEGALVVAKCNNSVNVRAEADENSDKTGLMYRDCVGYIMEYTDDWTKIQSGDLVGWIYNEYLYFGDEAKTLADEIGCNRATITEQSVRVRAAASTESEIMDVVNTGDAFDVVGSEGNWLIVDFEGSNGYINADLANVEFVMDYGETMEVILARAEAEKAAQEAAKKAQKEAERNQYYGVYAAQASDVELLGALIQSESGNQPYEGKVAVGAVVMNRVKCAAYPSTIYGVIYASGQFTPAGSGAVDKRLAKGVSSECLQAAQDAINGSSPVGAAMHFRPVGRHDGIIIGGHVFY